jgi:hypothetical protein
MLSTAEVCDESTTKGFYPVDFNQANITSNDLPESTLILYIGDMCGPNGTKATDFINNISNSIYFNYL